MIWGNVIPLFKAYGRGVVKSSWLKAIANFSTLDENDDHKRGESF